MLFVIILTSCYLVFLIVLYKIIKYQNKKLVEKHEEYLNNYQKFLRKKKK